MGEYAIRVSSKRFWRLKGMVLSSGVNLIDKKMILFSSSMNGSFE